MRTFSLSKAAVASVMTALALAPGAIAHAADYSTDTASSAAAASIFAGFGVFILFFIVIGVGFLVLWILMLIDALQRKNWQDDNQKNTWLIILIVSMVVGLSWIAAIIYYFMVRKPLGKATGTVVSAGTVEETPVQK